MRDTGLRFVNFLLHFTVVLCLALACRAQGASNIPNTISIQASGAPSGACGNNFVYTNSATNDFYNCVAGAWNKVSSAGGAGTVTSVICGSGLSGGTITTTGTCALATSAVGSAGMILLEEHTAATSAELDFTTCLSATYDDYAIETVGLLTSTSANIQIQASTNGGSSYDTGSNYAWSYFYAGSGAAGGNTGSQADTNVHVLNAVASGATNSIDLMGRIYHPSSTALFKGFSWLATGSVSGDKAFTIFGSGNYIVTASAMNAFRFIPSAGTFTSGTVRCYGLTK